MFYVFLYEVNYEGIPKCSNIKFFWFQLAAFLANLSAMESEEESKNVVDELMGMLPFDSLPMLELLLRTLSLLPVEVKYTS